MLLLLFFFLVLVVLVHIIIPQHHYPLSLFAIHLMEGSHFLRWCWLPHNVEENPYPWSHMLAVVVVCTVVTGLVAVLFQDLRKIIV